VFESVAIWRFGKKMKRREILKRKENNSKWESFSLMQGVVWDSE
jgi:hypothetical protein